jgi:hypothetical protein
MKAGIKEKREKNGWKVEQKKRKIGIKGMNRMRKGKNIREFQWWMGPSSGGGGVVGV